jgi:DNA (cytosine-5)-methyltransferase 1
MRICSFFSGAGGLDRGFELAGFETLWANEFDRNIQPTYKANFPHVILDPRSITEVHPDEVPDCDGIIGGPPCQSWSEAGAKRGINDQRGQLFYTYLNLVEAKKPLFFLAENVSGMLHSRNKAAFDEIVKAFDEIGYDVQYKLLSAYDYEVPQERERVIIVGMRSDLRAHYIYPKPITPKPTLRNAIYDLIGSAVPEGKTPVVPNHEYALGGYSPMFLSRNRVRQWDEPSFTIQAGARHAPLHPSAPRMRKLNSDKWIFEPGYEDIYRRLSIRECARIQTFPDSHQFIYTRLDTGYKMIGNAVPVNFAKHIAESIKLALVNHCD